MFETKFYEDEQEDLNAVVYKDGKCVNFIYSPELDDFVESLFEEAKLGFPDAFYYEDDIEDGNTLSDIVTHHEEKCLLVAEVNENIVIYPQRMGKYTMEVFKMELGEERWNEILQKVKGDKGVSVDI